MSTQPSTPDAHASRLPEKGQHVYACVRVDGECACICLDVSVCRNRPLCRLHLARCAPVLRASLSARWRAARYREYMASINLTQPTYNEPEPPTDLPPPLTQAYKTLLWDSNSLMVTPRPPSSTWAAPLRRSHSRYLTLQQPDPAANQPSFHLDAIDCAVSSGKHHTAKTTPHKNTAVSTRSAALILALLGCLITFLCLLYVHRRRLGGWWAPTSSAGRG